MLLIIRRKNFNFLGGKYNIANPEDCESNLGLTTGGREPASNSMMVYNLNLPLTHLRPTAQRFDDCQPAGHDDRDTEEPGHLGQKVG